MSVAREARGLSQTELARRIGVTQGYVSRVEAGLTSPTEQFVNAVASELGFPVEFFRQQARVYGSSVSELYHRKRAAAPAKALGQIHAWLNIIRTNIERLLHSAEDVEVRLPRHDPDGYRGVDEIASAIRAVWQLPRGPVRDLVGVLEDAGVIVIRMAFPTRYVDAISWWIPGLPPLVFVNKDISADRENWSLAHELGHLVMHQVARPEMEDEADVFASAFMMPADEIRPHLGEPLTLHRLQDLKMHWRVSMAALLRRAKDVGTISPVRYRQLQIKMSAEGYRTREPLESEFEKDESTYVRDLLEMHLTELGFTEEQLAGHLRLYTSDVQAIYGVLPGRTPPGGLRLVR